MLGLSALIWKSTAGRVTHGLLGQFAVIIGQCQGASLQSGSCSESKILRNAKWSRASRWLYGTRPTASISRMCWSSKYTYLVSRLSLSRSSGIRDILVILTTDRILPYEWRPLGRSQKSQVKQSTSIITNRPSSTKPFGYILNGRMTRTKTNLRKSKYKQG